jgi:hypothetical protein
MKTNIILTYVQGSDYFDNPDCNIFMQSLSRSSSSYKVCIYRDLSNVQVAVLAEYFDEVVPSIGEIHDPNCDRFLEYYKWLCGTNRQVDYVLHLDFRDVILQRDPFDLIASMVDIDVILVPEGMLISDSQINYWWAQNLYEHLRSHKYVFNQSQVINTGTIAAKYDKFLFICLLLFTNSNRKAEKLVYEQPIMNWISPWLGLQSKVFFAAPNVSNFCLTCEGVKTGFVDCVFENGAFYNPVKSMYYIVHQWDRLPCAESIRSEAIGGR